MFVENLATVQMVIVHSCTELSLIYCLWSLSTASRISLYSPGYYSYSTSLQQVDNVMCIGTELRLTDCPRDIHVVSTSTTVGMRCDPCEHIVLLIILLLYMKSAILLLDDCFNGAIRLADGESEREKQG